MAMGTFFMDIWQHLPGGVTLLYIITVIVIAILIVLENRNPLKTISWVLVLVLLPVAGIVFYLFFGQEYRRAKMFSRKGLKDLEKLRKLTKSQLEQLPQNYQNFSKAVLGKKQLINLMLSNSDALLTSDNEIRVLKDGEETFPAIFDALEKAQEHIHIEFYIVEDDDIGNYLREILIRKAKEGLEVRFIYDDVGSWQLSKQYVQSLKDAGVKIDCFMKVRFPQFTSRVNYRNHRKIVVIDGKVGFVGGLNIANRYKDGTKKLGTWRDTHLMLKGGAVAGLQIVFMADWYFVSKEVLQGSKYFKNPEQGGGKLTQIVSSGPDSDWESISQAYFMAIASAQERVYIATPYLIPTSEILNAMKVAALGGIDIRILLPQKTDAITAKWSSGSYILELLEAGVKIYYYKPGFTHSKLIVVDGVFSSVGTANFDFRSLETNFEVNAMIYDEEVASILEVHFEEDLENSHEIFLDEWKNRHWTEKAKQSFARILSPVL